MSVRTDIKKILIESDVTITKVAKELSKKIGKHYTQSNISQKLSRGTLKYEEAKLIGEILGYELKFVRTKPYI
jgi:signal recognition particle GTPase